MRVVFEFEVEDLPAYDDPNDGACKQNTMDLFRAMLLERIEAKSRALSQPDTPYHKEYLDAVDQDITLANRILSGLKYIGSADVQSDK